MRCRRFLWAVLLAVPPLLAVIALAYAATRDDRESVVVLRESGQPVLTTSQSNALRMAAIRVGFAPAVPRDLPADLELRFVDSALPPQSGVEAPRSILTFEGPDSNQPRWMGIAQSTAYWGVDLSEWEELPLGRDGFRAFTDSSAGRVESQYWLQHQDRMFVYLAVAGVSLTREDAVDLLGSLADAIARAQ